MNKELHSLLKRQIKRNFDEKHEFDDGIKKLLDMVNTAYREFDEDRKTLERSLDLSSKELLQANSELRTLLQALPDLIFIVDDTGRILDAKGGIETDLLMPRENYIGKSIFGTWDKSINHKFKNAINKTLESGRSQLVEYELNVQSNRKYYEAKILPLLDSQLIVVIRDFTNRVETEIKLRNNLEQIKKKNTFEAIINDISLLINKSFDLKELFHTAVSTIYDQIDTVDYVSFYMIEDERAVLKASKGYPKWFKDKNRVIPYSQCATWDSIKKQQSILVSDTVNNKYLGSAECEFGTQCFVITPIIIDSTAIGCMHIHSLRNNQIGRDEVNFVGIVAKQMATAIDKASQAEALRESEGRYRVLFDQAPYGVCLINNDFIITHCNQSMIHIFQSSYEKVIGLDLNTLLDKTFIPVFEKAFQGEVSSLESRYRASTSSAELCLAVKVVPLFDDKGKVYGAMGVVEDITERKKMEEEIVKSQKLESLGVLAGGIAHDFNNILSIILGNLSLAQTHLERKRYGKINDILSQACNAANRASDLVDQLMTFAKGSRLRKRTVSIPDMLKESIEFAIRGSNVKCQYGIPKDLKYVDVDESQINQVINNLIINAKEAMPDGGMIRVSAENVSLDDNNSLNLKGGEHIKLVLEDTGVGIPHEIIDKIFDPFFTTKGRGSGLGLATSHSIIAKHGGKLTVNSEVGKGTTFEIFIPCSSKDLLENGANSTFNSGLSGNILVMDDEAEMRRILEGMLVALGFTVETVENGEEAISKYKDALESGSPYNMVVLDLIIPGEAGGVTTLNELEKLDPGVKGIITSGYEKNLTLEDYESRAFKAYLKKPFSIIDLNKTILDVMK